MAKLAFLLALAQCTFVQSLPAGNARRDAEVAHKRAVTISSDISITTSYTSVASTLQSASLTESPSLTGVSQ